MRARKTVVILSDEHQARALGCAGHPFVKTPNLDRLAARGTIFRNAVTPSPICVPARAAFATGLPVCAGHYWDNSFGYDGRVPGWGHALQAAGIPVESIGKLHYQDKDLDTGFDVEHVPMHLHEGVGMLWASIRDPLPDRPAGKRMLGEYIGPGESPYTRYDRDVTALATQWIEAHAGSQDPWCLYIGLVAPHFPLVAPERFFSLYADMDFGRPKLHPSDGYRLHPWVQTHEDFWSHEITLADEAERDRAIASYFGLVSWMDHNVGLIVEALQRANVFEETRIFYASDHGENLGARGLWGKSNLYRESVDIPMIMAGPEIPVGTCPTPVSLLDLSVSVVDSLGLDVDRCLPDRPGRTLLEICKEPPQPERVVFSEYHAVGSESAGFMVRKGRWKLDYYVGLPPELFDLDNDPEEIRNLADEPAFTAILSEMTGLLRTFCDPEQTDALAKRDQAALVAKWGGKEAVLARGAKVTGATPPPDRKGAGA